MITRTLPHGELRWTASDGSVVIASLGPEATVDHIVELGTTGEYNSRGWPISTGEPDPDKPPRIEIVGNFTLTKYAPGSEPDELRDLRIALAGSEEYVVAAIDQAIRRRSERLSLGWGLAAR